MVFRVHKPDWLYESLPYLYAAAGLIVALVLPGWAAKFSGLLLISAGITVWKIRRDYRQRARREQEAERAMALAMEKHNSEPSLVQIFWRQSFEVGHELIDRQHRRLFVLGNMLINALMMKQSKDDIELMMSELVDDIGQHFKSEEEVMAGFNVPLSEEHKNIHRVLLAQVQSLQQRFHEGRLSVSELVGFIAYDVVSQHIIKEDLKFAPEYMLSAPASAAKNLLKA